MYANIKVQRKFTLNTEIILLNLKNIFPLLEETSDRVFQRGRQRPEVSVCPDNIKTAAGPRKRPYQAEMIQSHLRDCRQDKHWTGRKKNATQATPSL